MKNTPANILIVDDDPINIEILEEYLEDHRNYTLYSFENAEDALELLYKDPFLIDIALIDLMMPNIDGIDLTLKIKEHSILCYIPIIMQTASTVESDLIRGINAGVFYYITKPFRQNVLCGLIYSALQERNLYISLNSEIQSANNVLLMLDSGAFHCKTLDESHILANSLSKLYPDSERVLRGISELLINAIEHGNLNISYDDKSKLNESGDWFNEINRRLELPEYADKQVKINYIKTSEYIELMITDEGQGFDWYNFLELKLDRAFDSHGRGIAWAKMTSFDELAYLNQGNCVKTKVFLKK